MNGGARRRMASSPAAFTAAIDGFADRSNARHRPPERHSSVKGLASKRPFLALNANGAIRKMKPDRHKQNTRQRPPQSSSAAPFRPRCAAQAQAEHTRKTTVMPPTGPTAPPFPSLSWPRLIAQSEGLFMVDVTATRPAQRAEAPGMETRRAETAKRVRFMTARRAGPVPARVPVPTT